jgi:hypothetical protein
MAPHVRFMILVVMISILDVYHYIDRAFYLRTPIQPLLILTLIIVLYMISTYIKAAKRLYIDIFLTTLAIASVVFISIEILGYIFNNNHFEYTIVSNIIIFGIHYFALSLIVNKYKIPKDIFISYLTRIYLNVTVIFSSISLLTYFLFVLPDNNFYGLYVNKGFIISSSKVMYMAVLGVIILWIYPHTFRRYKRIITLILLTLTPILTIKTGAIILLIFIGAIYYLYINFKAKIVLTLIISILYTWFSTDISSIYNNNVNNVLYGFFSKELVSEEKILEGADQKQSTYIRHISNRKAMSSFYEKPIFGNGQYHIKNEIRYAGYFTHTFYIYVLASYGLVGGLFILLLFLTAGIVRTNSLNFSFKRTVLLTYFVYILLFVHVLPLWIIPSIVISKKYKCP